MKRHIGAAAARGAADGQINGTMAEQSGMPVIGSDVASVPGTAAKVGRTPVLAAATVPLVAVLFYVFADAQWGALPAFMPGFLAVVWVLDLLTAFLLFNQYVAGGSPRLAVLGAAYLWSSAVIVPHALVFPGLFAPAGLLGAVPSSAPWLWTAWHTGFPLLIGAATMPWIGSWQTRAFVRSPRARLGVIALLVTIVVTAVAGVAWLVTAGHRHIPVIITNGDYTILTQRFGPVIVGANLLAVALAATRFRRATDRGLEAWAFVAVTATCGDTVLTLLARSRFTAGWYGARLLALVAALVVLSALLHEVTLLYRRVRSTALELAERNSELHNANALRDHLVAVVSHELRTPLTAMAGIVEILQEGRDILPAAKVDDMFGRAEALTRRMSMLTEDLLAVSTFGKGELHVSPVDLELTQALTECARSFPLNDVHVEAAAGITVRADPLRLQQMLANYVRNAIKYGAGPIILSARAGDDGVQVRVRDHGSGVPPEFVPRLFDRFTRSEQAKAGPIDGSGLGLSIVATLAAAHGGRVWYEMADPGACFAFTVPAAETGRSLPDTPAPDVAAFDSSTAGRNH